MRILKNKIQEILHSRIFPFVYDLDFYREIYELAKNNKIPKYYIPRSINNYLILYYDDYKFSKNHYLEYFSKRNPYQVTSDNLIVFIDDMEKHYDIHLEIRSKALREHFNNIFLFM